MQIDILWLRSQFAQFNERYFKSELPTPRFHIGRSKNHLGTMSWKHKTQWGRTQHYDFVISISNYYDQSEHRFQNVLLHEMIHLAITCSGVKDTSPHGVVFRGMMQKLNNDGWNIQVMTNTQGLKKAYTGSDNIIRQYLVLALEMTDGSYYLSSVNPRYAGKLNEQLPTIHTIKKFAWYTTNDRWFENMPKVRSLRGRPIDQALFIDKTSTMNRVEGGFY